ncbi:MAG: hypothetical protein IJ087_12395, partial [Eggerthellaceae bacterium]|nr:hypothetical protein [Eggerthellaceae bacterium]
YAENLSIPIGDIGEWWGTLPTTRKEAQLDIVALATKADNEPAGRRFIIGSCKYTANPVGLEELDLIRNYATAFTNANDECFDYHFSKSGFTSSLLKEQDSGRATLVTLEDVYRR